MKQLLTFSLIACFALMIAGSSCTKEPNLIKHDTVTIKQTDTIFTKGGIDTLYKTLVLRPGPDEGQNTLTVSDLYAPYNLNSNPDITASVWTYSAQNGGIGIGRSFIKFIGLDGMPENAIIVSAKLSLYGKGSSVSNPDGTHPDNTSWLERVTQDWNPDSLTWNNQPPTTTINRAAVASVNQQWYGNALDIDVTHLVDDMLNTDNLGFCLKLQDEQSLYRNVVFASCKDQDSTKWPKLVVKYQLTK